MFQNLDSIKTVIDLTLPLQTTLPIDFTTNQIEQIGNLFQGHFVTLHHVAKIENKYHTIPYPLKLKKIYEKHGILLHRIFELCINVHGRQIFIKEPQIYKNAYYWFLAINKEILEGSIQQILNPYNFTNLALYDNPNKFTEYVKNGEKKRHILSVFRKELADIVAYKNPYQNTHLPIFSSLIEQSLKLSEQNNLFRQEYLLSYIDAARAVIREYDTPIWRLVSAENGEVKRQKIGRAKTVL